MAWWLSELKQMRQKRACVISVYLMGTPRKEQRFCAQKLQNICVCDGAFSLNPGSHNWGQHWEYQGLCVVYICSHLEPGGPKFQGLMLEMNWSVVLDMLIFNTIWDILIYNCIYIYTYLGWCSQLIFFSGVAITSFQERLSCWTQQDRAATTTQPCRLLMPIDINSLRSDRWMRRTGLLWKWTSKGCNSNQFGGLNLLNMAWPSKSIWSSWSSSKFSGPFFDIPHSSCCPEG